jgi:hypothetical protein
MNTIITTCALAALILAPAPALASDPIDVATYPELSADALLPSILAELKHTLRDPYSIRDFVLCPARGVKLKDGKAVKWSVSFSFNSKNGYGGYDGSKTYSALFRDGHLAGGVFATQFATNDGIEGLVNSMIVRRMATCATIADAKIQALLSPDASIYRAQ